MNRVLILGGSGLVGRAVINEMNKSKGYQPYGTYFENARPLNPERSIRLDIEEPGNIISILNMLKPQSVISCLRGDYEKQLSLHTIIAEYLKQSGGKLYFCSTANVFDKDLSKPHYEVDLPGSCTDYGQFKIKCESRITDILKDNACILRLPQIWGKDSPRMGLLLKLLSSSEKIIVYPRLFLNTITDMMIARRILYIIENNLIGTFHMAAEDVINYKDFYDELIMGLGFNNELAEENFVEEGCFAILSVRNNEFPEELRITNKSVINYLIRGGI